MGTQGVGALADTGWNATRKPVTSARLDSSALEKELPEIAARFMKQTTARRCPGMRNAPCISVPTKRDTRGPVTNPYGLATLCIAPN